MVEPQWQKNKTQTRKHLEKKLNTLRKILCISQIRPILMNMKAKFFYWFLAFLGAILGTGLIANPSEPWVEIQSLSARSNVRNCTIRVTYPKLNLLESEKVGPGVIRRINKILKKEFQDLKRYDNEYQCNRNAKKGDPAFHLEIKFDVKLNQSNIVSLYYYAVGYTAGAAHPENVYKGLTFDLRNGRLISFPELFRKNSNFLSVLDKEIFQQLKDMDVIYSEDEFKDVQKLSYDFYLTKDAVNIINLYEIHVMQSLEVSVPINKIKKVLDATKFIQIF
jgi:hypothetical protein